MATQYTAGLTQGQVLTADIMNQIGAPWESWTPVLVQGTTTFSLTVNYARYCRIQKLVIAVFGFSIASGTGTAANIVTLSNPITASSGSTQGWGSTWIYDASANTPYGAVTICNSTTTANFQGDWSGGSAFGATPAVQLTTSDQMRGIMIYEAA